MEEEESYRARFPSGITLSRNISETDRDFFIGPPSRLYNQVRVTRFGVQHARTVITEILAAALDKLPWRHRRAADLLVRNLRDGPIRRRNSLDRGSPRCQVLLAGTRRSAGGLKI